MITPHPHPQPPVLSPGPMPSERLCRGQARVRVGWGRWVRAGPGWSRGLLVGWMSGNNQQTLACSVEVLQAACSTGVNSISEIKSRERLIQLNTKTSYLVHECDPNQEC